MSDPDLRDPHLDRAYRELPREEPPVEVDERIRAAARRAVGARPQSLAARRRSWVSRWSVPVSLAASVVIVATLTLMIQDEHRPMDDVAPARAPAPSAVEPAAPPPAPEAARRKDAASAARPKPAPPVQVPEVRRAAPAADAAPPAAAPESQQSFETRRRVQEAPQAPAPLQAAPAAAPPPPGPGGLSDSLSRERATGERPDRAQRSAPAAARAEQSRAPEDWLEEIRRLKAQGRDADAAAELAEFRRRYPDYALPADLAR
jgi:hypothetical protein